MRLVYLLVGIIAFTIFSIYLFMVSEIDLFQYRAVRVGYTRFYQLMDSLFNEFRDEDEDTMIEDMFETIFQSEIEDTDIQTLTCSTWSSLNDLIRVNHERVIDTSEKVRNNPKKLHDRLQKDLQITNAIVQSYNTRLNMEMNKLPNYLSSYQNQLSDILDTVNDINQGFQYYVGDAIEKIDNDQYESHKSSCVRLAKILQQFELIIQSQNEAHLECACDVAKKLDEIVQNFAKRIHLCVNNTGDQFSNYMKETITPMANSMETAIQSVNHGIKRSKTSVEVFYQLPIKVRMPF